MHRKNATAPETAGGDARHLVRSEHAGLPGAAPPAW
jgi:hypothetical protein